MSFIDVPLVFEIPVALYLKKEFTQFLTFHKAENTYWLHYSLFIELCLELHEIRVKAFFLN